MFDKFKLHYQIRQLRSGDARAAWALGESGDVAAVPALISALALDSTRIGAAGALAQLKDPRAIQPLREVLVSLLQDRGPSRREGCIRALADALAELGHVESIPLLLKAGAACSVASLKSKRTVPTLVAILHQSRELRHAAAAALAQLRWQPKKQSDHIALAIAAHNYDALLAIGPDCVPPLLEELRHKHDAQNVLYCLGRLRDPRAVPGIVSCVLADPAVSKEIKRSGVTALGEIAHPDAVEPLITLLRSQKDDYLLRDVAIALGQLGKIAAVIPLMEKLDQEPQAGGRTQWPEFRRAAGSTVSEIKRRVSHECWQEFLGTLLSHRSPSARALAAERLLSGSGPTEVPALIALLSDPLPRARKSAAEALGNSSDPRAAPPLVAALDDPDLAVRLAVQEALRKILPDKSATVNLQRALQGRDGVLYRDVRERANIAVILATVGDPRAVSSLIEFMGCHEKELKEVNRHYGLSFAPWQKLDQLLTEKCSDSAAGLSAVLAALQDPRIPIRKIAATIIGGSKRSSNLDDHRRNAATIGPLVEMLQAEERDVRSAAWRALKNLDWHPNTVREQIAVDCETRNFKNLAKGGPAAVPELVAALKYLDEDTQAAVIEALGRLGPASTPELVEIAVRSPFQGPISTAARTALRHRSQARAAELLVAKLPSNDVLVDICGLDAVEPLAAQARHPDEAIRLAAIETLQKIYSRSRTAGMRLAPSAAAILVSALIDDPSLIRKQKLAAILDLDGWQPARPIEVAAQACAVRDIERCAAQGEAALPFLALLLDEAVREHVNNQRGDWQTCKRSASAIKRMRALLPRMLPALDSPQLRELSSISDAVTTESRSDREGFVLGWDIVDREDLSDIRNAALAELNRRFK